jgi:hypothetical protein
MIEPGMTAADNLATELRFDTNLIGMILWLQFCHLGLDDWQASLTVGLGIPTHSSVGLVGSKLAHHFRWCN